MAFDVSAVLICSCGLAYMVLKRRTEKQQSKLFIVVLVCVSLSGIANVVSEINGLYAATDPFANACMRGADYANYITHTALAPLFYLYLLSVCGESRRYASWRKHLIAAPFFIVEAAVLANPLIHWVYYCVPFFGDNSRSLAAYQRQ